MSAPSAVGPRPSADDARIGDLLAQLTLDEKIALIAGVDAFDVPGNARLGIPRLGTADSPFGVRAGGYATYYPAGLGLAATWNPALAQRVGEEIGADMRAFGRHYHLGPGVNAYRSPLNGRNFEYLGEDPWLAARMAVAVIEGVQSRGVCSVVKHFVGNESEYARHVTDSVVDERTLRELLLPPFEAAVKEARVGAVMSGYNLVNGVQMSAHRALAVDLLKGEWGFDGVLVSDWGGVHDTEAAANGGTDLEMPGPQYFDARALGALLASGRVSEATIDDKVRRLLRTAARFGWLDDAGADGAIPAERASAREAAYAGACESIVLLRNVDALLPIDPARITTVAVLGPNAVGGVPLGNGSAAIPTRHRVSVAEGLQVRLGAHRVLAHRGIPSVDDVVAATALTSARDGGIPGLVAEHWRSHEMAGEPLERRVDARVAVGPFLDMAAIALGVAPEQGSDFDTLIRTAPGPWATRWTGWLTPAVGGAHDVVVQLGGFTDAGYRLKVDGRVVADRWDANLAVLEATRVALDAGPHEIVLEYRCTTGFGAPYVRMGVMAVDAWVSEEAIAAAARADVVVIAAGFDAGSEAENWDRTFAMPPGQRELVERVLGVNPNVAVVLMGGGGMDVAGWVDRVPALLHAWYPGQEGGAALADVLCGDVNPSGRLPISMERSLEDGPSFAHYHPVPGTRRAEYREGVFTGYRGFDARGVAPLFAFGHGLSYTTFALSALEVRAVSGTAGADMRWTVSFDVTNTGSRSGAATPQLYVGDETASVARPRRELRGFAKLTLAPGETQRVALALDLRALAFWDVARHAWVAEAGEFVVAVGLSSADIALRASLTLDETIALG